MNLKHLMFEVKIKDQVQRHIIDRLQVAALNPVTAANCATTSLLFFMAQCADKLSL